MIPIEKKIISDQLDMKELVLELSKLKAWKANFQ